MSDTSINATVQTGGVAGVAGASFVHIENLTQCAAAPPPAPLAVGPIPPCPYPGLAYFGPQDSTRFFGREKAIEALESAVARRSFTALVGASGSGKSSVVLAGLAPRLDAQGGWRFSHFRVGTEPDKNPFAALARALAPLLGAGDIIDRLGLSEELAANLASGDIALTNVVAQCRAANPGKRILLIADQFEEVFTLVADEALRNRFIDTLIAAFPGPAENSAPDVCLVLTLRADFYTAALRHRPLADKLQDRVENLGPMTREELRDAIVKPAAQLVPPVEFDPGLVDAVLDDVEKRPGSLPLLQFALREMWGRLEKRVMTRAIYDSIGGVEGALAKRAQAIFDDATKRGADSASVALFRRLFTRLVTLGEGAEDTRRIVGRDELGTDAWALAQRLAGEDNRLVVTAAPAPGQETAEVVHEALFRNWPALVEWVSRDRAFQSWLRQLKPRVDEWRANPADEGALLRGGQLALAEDWVARRGGEVNDEEKAFVAASVSARDEQKLRAEDDLKREQARLAEMAAAQAKTARAQRGARWALGAIAAVMVLAGGLFYAQNSRDSASLAEGQAQLAEARSALNVREGQLSEAQAALGASREDLRKQQAAAADLQKSLDAEQLELKRQRADLLGELASAEGLHGRVDSELRFAIHGTRADLALPRGTVAKSLVAAQLAAAVWQAGWRVNLIGHEGVVFCAAFSRDGSHIVTASGDNTARVWDAATGKQIAILRGHKLSVHSAAFSPDGSRIVTASDDKTARIWDTATGGQIAILGSHELSVQSAAFSPDGLRIVTASFDKSARVWDATTFKNIAVLSGHTSLVLSAAFSSDGSRIVSASVDNTARIWDATTFKEIAVLSGHENDVSSAAFSPDGARIVTASGDKTARIWDAVTGKLIAILSGHEAYVRSATFSPDGSHIVTASFDRTVRIWDATTFRQIAVLNGHENDVRTAAFSPDGSHIVTASADGTARIWDAAVENVIAKLSTHDAVVTSAGFSPDGSRVVTASRDQTARIWDAVTGNQIAILSGNKSAVFSAAFSPNGSRIVTASADGTAVVWDSATGKQLATLHGHRRAVFSAAFNSDGSRIVTASEDRTARIWDASIGELITILSGHEGGVYSAAFSPDSSRIVTASGDRTARTWDAATGKQIVILRGHDNSVKSAAFSSDGSRIVTSSWDRTARIWDAATGKEISVLRGHENFVNYASFSSDGSRVVTASGDKTARIWDPATVSEIAVLRGHTSDLASAAFSPDGSRVVTASNDKTARIWDVHFVMMSTKDLLIEACTRRLNGLTMLTRDEMRLAGYPDSVPLIDVCAPGTADASSKTP